MGCHLVFSEVREWSSRVKEEIYWLWSSLETGMAQRNQIFSDYFEFFAFVGIQPEKLGNWIQLTTGVSQKHTHRIGRQA